MSPNAKRWASIALRTLLTAVAMVVVLRLIQFRDQYRIVLKPGPAESEFLIRWDVKEVRRSGERSTVVFRDGTTQEHASKDVVLEKKGFLTLFEETRKGLFLAMVVAFLIPFGFLALRWWILLEGSGFRVPIAQVFLMTYAGGFFNKFLPGAVGGDLTKAILAVQGEERKAAVVGTVILDRLVGLAVMIVLGAACMTPYVGSFEDRRLAILIYGLFGGMVLGYLVYFNPLLRRMVGSRLPFQRVRQELDGVFRAAKEERGRVALAALISLAAQSSGILIVYGLARSLGIDSLGLWAFFIFEPIIFIVTAIPISVGGWGVQEGAYAYLFGKFGGIDPNRAIALSVLYNISMILATIPGGVLFALGGARRRRAAVPEAGGVLGPPVPPGGPAREGGRRTQDFST
ncbi:MAG TPA: lysylphosphatidylglycerol synthase transmembrane domain-containing protein [Planctomycetota bacterium]|nr:lysylphosphatidylglycerol synthase transmembrane domain-containing protein [Planctomycetota bacterium]